MRRLVTLALLPACLAVGWLARPDARAAGDVARAPRPVTGAPRAAPVPILPTAPAAPAPGARPGRRPKPAHGRVVFDGRCGDEVHEAWVHPAGTETTLEGESAGPGVQHFELPPGAYDVLWQPFAREPPRHARVVVTAGSEHHLSAAAPFSRDQLWIPPGLGAVDLGALDLAGRPVAVDPVRLAGVYQLATDADGYGWLALESGAYTLAVGAHRTPVCVDRDRATRVEVRAPGLGEVRLDRAPEGIVTLAPVGGGTGAGAWGVRVEARRWCFVRPGRYRVAHRLGIERHPRPAGEVEVRAGEVVCFALPPLPPGVIRFHLAGPPRPGGFAARLTAEPLDGQPGACRVERVVRAEAWSLPVALDLVALHPGRWQVQAEVAGYRPVERVVFVTDARVHAHVAFEPVR